MFAGDAVGGTKEHIKGTEDISRGQKTAPLPPFSGTLKNLFLYRMYMSTHEAEAPFCLRDVLSFSVRPPFGRIGTGRAVAAVYV